MAQCQLQCVWLNRKYHRIGPLFQGRFKAVLHEPSEALMINRYIHLNPVRLKALGGHEARDVGDPQITVELARQRVDALEQYPWSSYAFFAGTRSAPAWICTEAILDFFGEGSEQKRQRAFRQQLQEAAAAGHWETGWKAQVKYTVFLGCAEFVDRMRKLLRGNRDEQTGVRRGAGTVERLPWPQIVSAVSAVWNRPWQELLSARGSGARETALFIYRQDPWKTRSERTRPIGGRHPSQCRKYCHSPLYGAPQERPRAT